jgi:hypothetical protein
MICHLCSQSKGREHEFRHKSESMVWQKKKVSGIDPVVLACFHIGTKADRIGSYLYHIPIHVFFLPDVERSGYYTDAVTDADFFGCRIWCEVGSVAERMHINIVG